MKLEEQKIALLEQLKKTPIIQFACEKVGISRASYYRWRKEDKNFAKSTDKAISDGSLLINDMAESQLISLIRDKHPTGIIYWLKHHHPTYSEKLHLSKEEERHEELRPEQAKLLARAMEITQENYKKIGIPKKNKWSKY